MSFLTRRFGFSWEERKACQNTWHGQFHLRFVAVEKKAGGPIGTNSFGDSGFVVLWCV